MGSSAYLSVDCKAGTLSLAPRSIPARIRNQIVLWQTAEFR
jgi:hypothetical protein